MVEGRDWRLLEHIEKESKGGSGYEREGKKNKRGETREQSRIKRCDMIIVKRDEGECEETQWHCYVEGS